MIANLDQNLKFTFKWAYFFTHGKFNLKNLKKLLIFEILWLLTPSGHGRQLGPKPDIDLQMSSFFSHIWNFISRIHKIDYFDDLINFNS